nr:unnamed protein product [Digitaria exilis]
MASNGSSTLPGISLARSAVSAGGGRDAEQLGEGEAAALLHLHPAAPPGTSLEAIRHGSPTLFGRSNDPSFPLRKWNERWVILDPTTGKIEYKQETSTIQVCEESSELCSTTSKHVEDDNVDKACVSDTDPIPITENIVELDDEGVDIPTVGDTEWANHHSSEVSDVREVTTEPEENSLDIPIDT